MSIKKAISCQLSAISLLLGLFSVCYGQSLSSTELINNAKQYDGKSVVYEGEVIGEVMVRGDYAWINVNDGNSALGIWINTALAKSITYAGSYKFRGDRVEITGIFHRACSEHGGDLDIHAQAMRKISSGRTFKERPNINKRNTALVLLGVLCLVLILRQFRKTLPRK